MFVLHHVATCCTALPHATEGQPPPWTTQNRLPSVPLKTKRGAARKCLRALECMAIAAGASICTERRNSSCPSAQNIQRRAQHSPTALQHFACKMQRATYSVQHGPVGGLTCTERRKSSLRSRTSSTNPMSAALIGTPSRSTISATYCAASHHQAASIMQRAAGRPSLAAICDRVPTRTRDAQRKKALEAHRPAQTDGCARFRESAPVSRDRQVCGVCRMAGGYMRPLRRLASWASPLPSLAPERPPTLHIQTHNCSHPCGSAAT